MSLNKPLKSRNPKIPSSIFKDGTTEDVTLTDVKYVPGLWVNLFSIGQALKNGFSIGNKDVVITLTKGSTVLKFDRIILTHQGFVIGMEIQSRTIGNIAAAMLEAGSAMDINAAHEMLGHCSLASVRRTASALGWKLTGEERPCESFARAKSKQTKVRTKESANPSTTPCERLCIDISCTMPYDKASKNSDDKKL